MDFMFKFLLAKAKDYLFRNYKTTLVGVIGALVLQYPPLAPYKDAIIAGAVALVGIFAKDGDTTGITPPPVKVASTSDALTDNAPAPLAGDAG